jgi:hypothetical protein
MLTKNFTAQAAYHISSMKEQQRKIYEQKQLEEKFNITYINVICEAASKGWQSVSIQTEDEVLADFAYEKLTELGYKIERRPIIAGEPTPGYGSLPIGHYAEHYPDKIPFNISWEKIGSQESVIIRNVIRIKSVPKKRFLNGNRNVLQ